MTLDFEQSLRASLSYDPETGLITRLCTRGNAIAGTVAGTKIRQYTVIDFGNRKIMAHRIAFFLKNGRWPLGVIDHINGNRSDNRWSNLRECQQSDNAKNQTTRPRGMSGVRGVRFNLKSSKSKPWEVLIKHNYKQIYIGRYATKEEAIAARYAASAKYHGEFSGVIEEGKLIKFTEAAR